MTISLGRTNRRTNATARKMIAFISLLFVFVAEGAVRVVHQAEMVLEGDIPVSVVFIKTGGLHNDNRLLYAFGCGYRAGDFAGLVGVA